MTAKTDILLKEYEACQSHNNSIGNQTWISISILITVNLLVLGQVISGIVLKSVSVRGWANLFLVVSLAVAMIIILWIFWRWYKRVTFQMLLNRERMRDIETKLGMWKNWRVYGLDLLHGSGRREDRVMFHRNPSETIQHLGQHFGRRRGYLIWFRQSLHRWRHWWRWSCMLCRLRQQKYEPPTTKGFPKFNHIFPLLITLWVIVIVMAIPAVNRCLVN